MKRFIYITVVLLLAVLFISQVRLPANDGKQSIYSYESESFGYSDIESLYTTDSILLSTPFFSRKNLQVFKVTIRCNIRKTVLGKTPAGLLCSFEIMHPVLEIDNGGLPINTDVVKQEFTHPMLAEISKEGLISAVRIDTAITDFSATIFKDILARLQFARPSGSTKAWQVQEETTAGTFRAGYHFLGEKQNELLYLKTNKGYIRQTAANKLQKIKTDSKTTIATDRSGEVQKMHVSESQVVLVHQDTITASGTRINILLSSVAQAPTDELAVLQALASQPNYKEKTALSTPLSEDKINRIAYRNTLQNDNLQSLLQKAAVIPQGDAKAAEQLTLQVRALAYLAPENCSRLAALLKKEPRGSAVYSIISNALAKTGKPEAIDALAGMIRERKGEEDVLIDLLPALATAATPTAAAVKIAKELSVEPDSAGHVVSTAQLALGGMAHTLSKTDPEQAKQLTRFITDSLNFRGDTLQQILVLGNTGAAAVFPVLQSYVGNRTASVQVKTAAISSLRLIQTREAANLLKSLQHSSDTLISKKSKETIAFRKVYFENQE